jgi:hypothetical protein
MCQKALSWFRTAGSCVCLCPEDGSPWDFWLRSSSLEMIQQDEEVKEPELDRYARYQEERKRSARVLAAYWVGLFVIPLFLSTLLILVVMDHVTNGWFSVMAGVGGPFFICGFAVFSESRLGGVLSCFMRQVRVGSSSSAVLMNFFLHLPHRKQKSGKRKNIDRF